MTDMTLTEAIAALRKPEGDWVRPIDVVVRAIQSGDLIPASDARQSYEAGMDAAADKILGWLAKAVGGEDYTPVDGTEEWDGDVHGTVYAILKAGYVYDDEDGRVAKLSDARLAEARGWNNAMLTAISLVAESRNVHTPGPVFKVLNETMGKIDDARFAGLRRYKNDATEAAAKGGV